MNEVLSSTATRLGGMVMRAAAMLLVMMLTMAQTAWAETKTFTYTVGLDWAQGAQGYCIEGNNGDKLNLGTEVGYLSNPYSITFPDVTITITSSGNYVHIAHYSAGNTIGFDGFDYTFRFESSKYYISHLSLSGNSNINIDNNTKNCTVTWLNTYGLTNRFEVTLTDTKPTHYYDITYELGNGTNDSRNPKQYEMSTGVASFYNATRTGYRFDGWFSNPEWTEALTSIPENSTGAKTLYAKWIINQYTLSFNTNGGTAIAPITQDYDTDITVPANPTRTGYTFTEWDRTIPTKMPAENITFTAGWAVEPYDITYDLAGGELQAGQNNPATYNVESNNITLINPTRTGYTFLGWTGSNGLVPETAVTITQGSTTGDKAYTANWQINQYAITYDLAGGELQAGQSNPATYNVESDDITLKNPTRTGYTFTGWTGGNGTTPESSVTITKGSTTGDKTYTAGWSINQYTITFVTGDGGTVIAPITQDYDSDVTCPANPTRTGCTFTSWDKAIPTKMPAEDMTITAGWEVITYNITYDLAGGELQAGQSNPATYNVESDDITLINPSLDGSYFVGWTGSNGTSPETTVTISKGSAGDKTYTANWSVYQYAITYELNGGCFDPYTTILEGYNESTKDIEFSYIPMRDGYSFRGWTGPGYVEPTISVVIPAGSTGNRTYTALWAKTNYYIVYELNGGTNDSGNPSSYNIESETFTIQPATREGYIFLGWTGWTFTTPQKTITVPTGTMGTITLMANWGKDYSNLWSKGTGTEDDPYIIDTTTDLDQLASIVNGGDNLFGIYFKLGSDITYTGGSDTESNYTAIGKILDDGILFNHFKGTFDGDGHTISGIRIYRGGNGDADGCQGLFGSILNATIKNVTLTDAIITGYKYVGGIAGYSINENTIENCHVTNSVTIHAIQEGAKYHGGILGNSVENGTTVSHCTSAVQLSNDTNVNASTCDAYGGIIGFGGKPNNNLVIGATIPAVKQYYGAIGGSDAEAIYLEGELYSSNLTASNNFYANCTVGGVANATNVGFAYKYMNYDSIYTLIESESGIRAMDVIDNSGAVPGIILYDKPSKIDINSTILTTVGNVEVPRFFLSGRTLWKDGAWNTLCLPFNLSAEQIAAHTGFAGCTLMELDTARENGFDPTDGTLYLWFKTATAIAAGVPYLVKWESGDDIVNPVFSGVTINATAPTTVTGSYTGLEKVLMVGTYSPVSVAAGDKSILFLGDANTLYYPDADSQMRSCTAYFSVPYIKEYAGSKVRAFSLNFDGDDATVIRFMEDVERPLDEDAVRTMAHEADAWYSPSGIRLNGKPTQRGLYIHNGKKVVIK